MKQRLSCGLFLIAGLAWLSFVAFDLFAVTLGDCIEDTPCEFYRPYVSGFIFWRGLAGGLLLVLAYLFFRNVVQDDDDV